MIDLTLRALLAAALTSLLLIPPAFAQEGADLDEEAAGLEPDNDGLLEKAPTEKPVLADPDEKLAAEVEARRNGLQEKINTIQSKIARFPDLDEGLNKLNTGTLKNLESFIEEHRKALEGYRAAVERDDGKAQAKLGAQVIKLRQKFIKGIDKLEKDADKLVEKATKLEEKLAKEEAEAAAEAATAEGKEP
ncbi:MAG: hypothetical protein KC620_04540 [Myxococcales bacterium]|nr:hypothetical protein [Myxococcales bacterium]